MKQKRKDLLTNLSSSFFNLVYSKVVECDSTILEDELNKILRALDYQIEKSFELKVPNSPLIFEQTGFRFWDKKRVKEEVEREHIIRVFHRLNKAKELVLFRGYDKLKLYDWLEKTLYLVYRLKDEEKEFCAERGEELIPDELKKPNKWEVFNI